MVKLSICILAAFLHAQGATADSNETCGVGVGQCQNAGAHQKEHNLLQRTLLTKRSVLKHSLVDLHKGRKANRLNKYWSSDCADRLQEFAHADGAACIVVRSNQALMVKVPYGRRRGGWDLPGGKGDKGYEAACETAERETCEETGLKVRAVAKLTDLVFRCEVESENYCTHSVDEGFLRKGWFPRSRLSTITYRDSTWVQDKQSMLRQQLRDDSGGEEGELPATPGNRACDSNAGCAGLGLSGNCCPSDAGVMLGCCR